MVASGLVTSQAADLFFLRHPFLHLGARVLALCVRAATMKLLSPPLSGASSAAFSRVKEARQKPLQ